MNIRKAFAGAIMVVLVVCMQTDLSRAQQSDTERLRQLERDLMRLQEEVDTPCAKIA